MAAVAGCGPQRDGTSRAPSVSFSGVTFGASYFCVGAQGVAPGGNGAQLAQSDFVSAPDVIGSELCVCGLWN